MSRKLTWDEQGKAAFPVASSQITFPERGMSLRAYLAGRAMQGILSSRRLSIDGVSDYKGEVALASVAVADALIAELNKPVEEESHE